MPYGKIPTAPLSYTLPQNGASHSKEEWQGTRGIASTTNHQPVDSLRET